MGREIRRVPANWEHPKRDNGNYTPLFDGNYSDIAKKWKEDFAKWEAGTHEDLKFDSIKGYEFWEWEAPPSEECYPKYSGECVWFQMYENVTEGTPVTPPFETAEELVDYLVGHGTFWDQMDGKGGWKRENAESFVKTGFAMSAVCKVEDGKVVDMKLPRDGQF